MFTTELAENHPAMLPLELQTYVDTLTSKQIHNATPADIVDVQLAYGSSDVQDAARGQLHDNLDTHGYNYLDEVEKFLASSSDTGAPRNIFQLDPQAVDMEFTSMDNGPATHRRPRHEQQYQLLHSWLETAGKRDPTAAAAIITKLVDTVFDTYDPIAFMSAIPETEYPRQAAELWKRLEHDARLLAEQVGRSVAQFADEADVVELCAGSAFMQRFGDEETRARLLLAKARLQSTEAPEWHDEFYTDIAQELNSLPAQGGTVNDYIVGQIAQHLPATLDTLAQRHPQAADEIYMSAGCAILALDPLLRTPDHEAALETVETFFGGNLSAYTQFLGEQMQRGHALRPDQLDTFIQLTDNDPANTRIHKARTLLCTFMPVDKLVPFLAAQPLSGNEPYEIAIRRLAQAGAVTDAHALVTQQAAHYTNRAGEQSIIQSLLAIYEETGDETAWQEAQRRIDAIPAEEWTSGQQLQTLLNSYAAAHRQGNTSRVLAAETTLHSTHTAPEWYERRMALVSSIQVSIHLELFEQAEAYATQLFIDTGTDRYSCQGVDALLTVIDAYLHAGRTHDAGRVVQTFFTREPYPQEALTAIELLMGNNPDIRRLQGVYSAHRYRV